MKHSKTILKFSLLVLIILAGAVVCSNFLPTYRVKSLVRSYNHWSDPGLIQGEGLTGLFKFWFLNKRANRKLNRLLSPECKIISEFADGRIISITKDDYIGSFTGVRFVSDSEQILLGQPVIESKKDHFVAEMTRAYCEGNKIEILESDLIIEKANFGLLISEIRNIVREPSEDEVRKVRAIIQSGRYNPKKGLGGRYLASSIFNSPSFSPDSKRIVFSSLHNKSAEIYTVNLDGSDPKRLTDTKYWELKASFTPNGKSILFISDKDNYAGEPYLIDIDGSNYRRLVPDYLGVADARYSPEGNYVAFTIQKGTAKEVYIMRQDGSDIKRLTETGRENSSLVFSPDSKKIYFSQQWYDHTQTPPRRVEIYSINIDGTSLKQLTHDRERKAPLAATNDHVLFYRVRNREQDTSLDRSLNELWLMKSDGTAQRCLVGERSHGGYGETKIFPDYRSVVFVDDIRKPFRYDVYTKRLFGLGKIKRLTTGGDCSNSNLDVSPDGKYIVYISQPRGSQGYIRIISIETGEIKSISRNY